MKRLICIFLVLISLVGCAIAPEYLNPPAENSGYIVGSIGKVTRGRYKNMYGISALFIRKVGTEDKISISYSQDPTLAFLMLEQGDIKEANRLIDVFSLSLLPGDYEIFGTFFYHTNGMYEKSYSSNPDFSMPIKVEQGKATYIGEFVAYGTTFKNVIGFDVPGAGFFEYNGDKFERDWPIIKGKFPIVGDNIHKNIFHNAMAPFVMLPNQVRQYKIESAHR